MGVTRRFAILAMMGIPLLFVGVIAPAAITALIFWVYNLVIFALLAVDFILSPPAFSLKVRRANEDAKLSHKAVNRVSFFVYNPSHFQLQISALDTISDRHFKVSNENMQHSLSPGEERLFTYDITPSKRGAFTFSKIHLKAQGLLGLSTKYHTHDCPMEFKVYPNLKDLGRYRLMVQNNRLLGQGDKTIRLFGTGTEFESLRPYVEGDDYRKINWLVTARTGHHIVNNYQIEKNQPIFLMIDSGRPMSYSINGYKKLDYAINAALVLADIVGQKGDQSGLLVFDTKVQNLIKPGKGAAHRNRLMEALYHIEESRSTSNYEEAFRTLCRNQKRRSIVFIFTDFETLEEGSELTRHIALLKRRHFPIVVFMKNEELIALSDNDDQYVQEVAQDFLQERKQLLRMLNAMSIPNVETEAEKFSLAAVNQYLGIV